MFKNVGAYSKFVVAGAGAIIAGLQPYYGSQHWFTGLTAGLAAALVYIVPNIPKG